MLKNKIGIVIIGRNEGERLVLCLKSVLKANVPVVYVDSQSTDDSVYNAHQYHVPTLTLDNSKPINASRARNAGFNMLLELHTNLEYVHFIDGDCELAEDWLENAMLALSDSTNIAIVCGRLHEKYRNCSLYTRLCDIDWYIQPGEIEKCGGIFTMRCDVFNQLNGFDETLIAGADPELCFRVRKTGWKILCITKDMGTHDSAMVNFSQWWRRCVKIGYGYANGIAWGGWARQYRSSILWGGIIPAFLLLGLTLTSYSALLLSAYPIQMLRIFLKNTKNCNLSNYDKIIYASFCMLAKFPQMQGILKFYINKTLKSQQTIIEYKKIT